MGLLDRLDYSPVSPPEDTDDQRELLLGWLDYQRAEFRRKWRDLDPDGIAQHSVPPVDLSVLGLIRHMTQMEEGWVIAGLGGLEYHERYGEDDYAGGSSATVDTDVATYLDAVERADAAIAGFDLTSKGHGHGKTLAWTLVKMIDEYAIHAGQAHMIRFAALGQIKR